MFEYSQGYEIDGSDTSYTIVTPDREKCVEILKYYLTLKTIHRRAGVRVYSVTGKQAKALANRSFRYEDYEELWEILKTADINTIEFEYSYVSSGQLFPEIKNEIIDMIFGLLNKNKPDLVNPTLIEPYTGKDYVFIAFHPASAQRTQEYNVSISRDEYVSTVIKGAFFTLEFNCRLGISYPFAAYGIHKLAKAFPELDIEVTESVEYISYTDISCLERYVEECLDIESNDFHSTLERILTHDSIVQKNPLNNQEELTIRLVHIPSGIEKYNSQLFYENYEPDEIVTNKKRIFHMKKDPMLDILKGIFEKQFLPLSEYIASVEKLAKADYFTDIQFSYYTTFRISVMIPTLSKVFDCHIRFAKIKGEIKLQMFVPYQIRGHIKKLFNI